MSREQQAAKNAVSDMISLGVTVRQDMDQSFWYNVGNLKATIRRISLADCCAIALGQRTHSSVVTSDHHEFDPIVGEGICEIIIIR